MNLLKNQGKYMITMEMYITSSGKYPEREKFATDEVKSNAEDLLNRVNNLLEQLEIANSIVSSGFRPTFVNAKIPNAAKSSGHIIGKSIDILDPAGKLKELVAAHPEKLRTLQLFLEDPKSTNGWMHLDSVTRPDRPSRIFIP